MAETDRLDRAGSGGSAGWGDVAQLMFRAAQAVSHPGGPGLFADLVRELAALLRAATVFIAVYTDGSRSALRTLAARLDGEALPNFDCPLEGLPCAGAVGQGFGYVARGAAAGFGPGTVFGAKGMDAFEAYPLNDGAGTPLGLLVAMDRQPIADARLAEALLKIFAGRIAAELELSRADEALRTAALAVSSARGETVFAELARYLATILHVELAFAARHEPESDPDMHMMAVYCDGAWLPPSRYRLAASPCVHVLGRRFHAFPSRLRELFPDDVDAQVLGLEAYAGFPLTDHQGRPLGTLGVASRKPLAQLERIESMLQIFAVRAAAELERLRSHEALRRSESNYRAIFEASEDAIYIHDWDTGDVLDVNPKACSTSGYSAQEMRRIPVADLSSGEPPYTGEQALAYLQLAKLDRCPPFEWHRRNKDGSLHWDEVRLKPVHIDGRPHLLAFTREITRHRSALAALQAQEQKYRAIFDGSIDSMVLWSRSLHVVDANEAFERMTGLSRSQVVGRHWTERPDADDIEGLLGLIEGALQGRIGQRTTTVSHADGSRFAVELRYLPVRLGDEDYALGVGRDVSERLEQEHQLRLSEAQYRGIFNASADALVLRDADFCIVDVNATYEAMSGYAREEVLGANRVLANPAEVAPTIRALHQRALAGESISLETQLVRRDGARYELELRGVPITHRGAPHVLYMGRDMTERNVALAALRSREEQYRAIFDGSADALVLCNRDVRIVDVNLAFTRLYGHRREEVVGEGFGAQQELQPPARRVEMMRAGLSGQEGQLETRAVRKDGSRFDVELRYLPISYAGEPHVLAVARDISARRAAEAERTQLEAQLRQAQKMEAIGQLTGGIAHDFNNILTSVIGYLVLGQERAGALADATLQRQLGQAQLAAQRARELIAQMLAFARRQRGERRTLALAPLVEQALQLLRATLPSSVAVDFALPGQVGEEEAACVEADAVQLEQVLFNLCINARDAINGTGLIRVRLGQRGGGWRCASCRTHIDAGRWLELSVADDGSGISPDVVERIFEPFTSTKEAGRGSGMGLAMVHGIVHDHGGHVIVETAPGAGSVFRVLLPPARGAPRGETGAAPRSLPGGALAGRVMVVDDEAMVGDFMAELLGGWGLDVVLHRDPLQALAWLEGAQRPLDLLITDQTMPQLAGLALA
ncbi:MAG: PAS domain S-box protein, partial [Burkholderiaceae bacterium]|nr:PAS domain S-box protein [Burkholderiaceae bacterium]